MTSEERLEEFKKQYPVEDITLKGADIGVVVAYFVIIIGIGVVVSRGVKYMYIWGQPNNINVHKNPFGSSVVKIVINILADMYSRNHHLEKRLFDFLRSKQRCGS